MHEFEQIEDAVKLALTPMLLGDLKTLEFYAGQFDVEAMERVTLRYPCIYISSNEITVETQNRNDIVNSGFTLFIGDQNTRSANDTAGGIHTLLESSRTLLHRQKILAGWTPATLKREVAVVYYPTKRLCIYAAEYKIKKVR